MSDQDAKSRVLTLVFTDLADSTALKTRHGDSAIESLLTRHRQHVIRLAADCTGRVIDWAGDGCFLTFETSSAAVVFALRLQQIHAQEPDLPGVRIGIHLGEVTETFGPAGGPARIGGLAVDLAARISSLAKPGQVLMSSAVYNSARQRLGVEAFGKPVLWQTHGTYALKGFDEPMDIGEAALEGLASLKAPLSGDKARLIRRVQPIRRSGSNVRRLVLLSVAVLVLVVGGWWIARQQGPKSKENTGTQSQVPIPSGSPADVTDQKSIAVLPFVSLSPDAADEYLSDGMTEELLNTLAQVPGLRVPGRSSSFAFKGRNEEDIFRKVGEQLQVTTVLEGSVRKAGDKVRITAQLINVADGYHLWSDTYDRDMTDILAVQTEVAQQVVEALQGKLGIEAARALTKTSTESPEAHRLYLLGRYHFAKATQAGWSEAIKAFELAIQLDPNYALAYCGLADNYNFLGGRLMRGKEAWIKEKEAAQKAVELDPYLADARVSLALALTGEFDWSGSEREFKRAVELNPNLALAHDQYAWILTLFGRFDEAAAHSKIAVELDPLSPLMHVNRGYWFYLARRFDEANTHFRTALELDPNYPWALLTLGWTLLWQGDIEGSLALIEKAQSLDADPWSIGSYGYALAVSRDRAKAEQILRDLENLAKQRYVTPSATTVVYLGLGEKEKALDWLDKVYEDRDPQCWFLNAEPIYDSVRTEPRFQALLEKVRFAQ